MRSRNAFSDAGVRRRAVARRRAARPRGCNSTTSPRATDKAVVESAQTGVDRLALAANGALECFDRDRQDTRAGNRAEHHGVDDGARFARGTGKIAEHDRASPSSVRRSPAARHRAGCRPCPSSRRADRSDAIEEISVVRSGVTKPFGAGAARFGEFGRDHQVDVAGLRIERHHRLGLAGLELIAEHFDVIGRRAGALRDARAPTSPDRSGCARAPPPESSRS